MEFIDTLEGVSVREPKYGGQQDLSLLDSWGRATTLLCGDLESMDKY
jgi:hypothetical protein